MNLWQHCKQHLQAEEAHLVTGLESAPLPFPPLSFLLRYSNTIMTNHTSANSNDPNARLPKLYLNNHHTPLKSDAFPRVSLEEVKYQTQTATIITNCVHEMIIAATHKSAKK
jgi:hypothetical protein